MAPISTIASTIWPIATGLYWKKVNPTGAAAAMVFGTGIGLVCYFTIGFYVAALVSAFVSMTTVLLTTWLKPASFEWARLSNHALQKS